MSTEQQVSHHQETEQVTELIEICGEPVRYEQGVIMDFGEITIRNDKTLSPRIIDVDTGIVAGRMRCHECGEYYGDWEFDGSLDEFNEQLSVFDVVVSVKTPGGDS